ncbi:uncharacterized protein Z518_01710 [Rhinocladiella mackenziei CBS 650.93]|uniref:Zn(2)-C6 fungal-type domain-containing protein n=1 Tax=Rhinocladiella mackenziei CBS 650.93 TaxID=1442369 RepID=A0A0D2J4J6_9EURO|nr:uncharacterized protein Z518_01710 [Rhinocladiella mackenziei CBS 650.93]KIX10626.1 hypothetical protein Z518_01710 [Rhinocladiella mackenziei CBS 650.93]
MPGVPSGRACEACRQQKKKCDETTPCSRCSRLGIPCVGSGQRRFQFKDQSHRFQAAKIERSSSTHSDAEGRSSVGRVSSPPSNALTILVSGFAERVQPATNLKYNLIWAYGGFLLQVPKRLGSNEALDAAASCLITAHQRLIIAGGDVIPQALAKYSQALNALRKCLDDPVEACSANTLCAVMILLMCQMFIGLEGTRYTGHCEGAAKILKARGTRPYNPEDQFESVLLLTLRGPVLFEGLFNNRIHFTREDWETLVQNELDQRTGAGNMMNSLARVPPILERGRIALRDQQEDELRNLCRETKILYDPLKAPLRVAQANYLESAQKFRDLQSSPVQDMFSSPVMRLYGGHQRMYGLALLVQTILNGILRSLSLEHDVNLESESDCLIKEIVSLAEDATIFRPLGSCYMGLCLVLAWAGTADLETRLEAERLYKEYRSDFPLSQDASLELASMSSQLNSYNPLLPGDSFHP